MCSISISHLRVKRSGSLLLDDVSITAHPGELIVLLGRSGAGKSTLLRALAGLIPSDGSIIVDGIDIHALPPHERPIAMLMDHPSLFRHMSVRENITFAHRERNHANTVDAAVLSLGIDHLTHRYPHQLSLGQQQKVALARALIRQPSLMLFDEPLAHVDTYSSEQLKAHILHTHRRLGCTTFYVTHDIDEAFSIADRIIYLSNGRVVQDGSPQYLREQPRTAEIARHLHASVFLPTTATISRDTFDRSVATLTVLGQRVQVAAAPDLPSSVEPTPVVVVGYPDSVTAELTGNSGRLLVADTGQVIRNIYMGSFHEVAIETMVGTIVIHCDPDDELSYSAAGDEVRLQLIPEKLWVLPREQP